MKLGNIILLMVVLLAQTARANTDQQTQNQFYLDNSDTQSDEIDHEASCDDLVPGIERSLQQKANARCGSNALRQSDWDVECFRPSMHHQPQDYVFAKVGASFECQ